MPEEVAVIDHLSKGRTFVGFARGYQSRWTNTFGQHFGTRATKSPNAAVYNAQTVLAGFSQETQLQKDQDDDAHNRRIFEDNIELVVKAWTLESFTHKGPAWQVPYPYEAGIEDWPLARAGVTQKLGALGEVDEAGVWRRASVAPAPRGWILSPDDLLKRACTCWCLITAASARARTCIHPKPA